MVTTEQTNGTAHRRESALGFKKATKATSKLRLALAGPAGSGKTYTSLAIAERLDQPVAVVDTELRDALRERGTSG